MSKKISQLPAAAALTRASILAAVEAGSTTKATLAILLGIFNVQHYGVSTTATAAANTANATAAVAAAAAASAELFWPDGTYLTSGSVPLLHTVRHNGPGAIQRGADVFRLQPKYGQTNRLYVATTGSAANDGLSSAQPMAVPQDAFTALRNYGPVLDGSWNIKCAAGTTVAHTQTHDTPSRDWVVIQGPAAGHPNVPTFVMDGTAVGANKHGFVVNGQGVQLWAQDIKFTNYNAGAQNSCGIAQGYGAKLYAKNVHCANCDFAGILADQGDICLVGGGIITGCRSGVILNATRGTVGYGAASTADGTQINNCTQNGVYWSRGAQGHVDYCILDQNPTHVQIESAARAHILGNDFRRASVQAIAQNTDGSWFEDPTTVNVYNDGTGNANAKRYFTAAFCGKQQNWTDAATSEMLLLDDDTVRTVTNAAKTQIGADLVLPGGGPLPVYFFADKKTRIRIRVRGDLPAAASSIGVDFFNAGPGVTVMEYSASTGVPGAVGFDYECVICPSALAVQRTYGHFSVSNLGTREQNSAAAANMALAQTIRIMGQSTAGTITVRRVEVWISG
jgi:hypothetical protein